MTAAPPLPFDAAQDLRDAPRVGGRVRPRDAATLILVRGRPGAPEVLMGRRAPGHVFMASKWVFPGGRIDRSDFSAASADDPPPQALNLLTREMPARRARALALSAVRETWEETGLVLGRAAPPASVVGPWRDFRAAGLLPVLSPLSYVARAVTPPGRVRRYDTRFFMANASSLLDGAPGAGSGELDEIAWIPLAEARALDLPAITRFIVGEVGERLSDPGSSPGRPLPYVRQVHGRHTIERL